MPAWRAFGFGFFTSESWNPVTEKFGALPAIYGTLLTSFIAMLIGVPISLGIAIFLTEICPERLRRTIGTAIELLAGIPSIIYGIWGLFVFAPWFQTHVQPLLIDTFANVPVLNSLFAGPPYGIGMLTAGLILAIMVLPFITWITREVFETVPPVLKEAADRYRLHPLGSDAPRGDPLYSGRHHRRGHARLGPRARRDHGGDIRHRQRASHRTLDPRSRHDYLRLHRQRVHRGRRRGLYRLAGRARPHPVLDHLYRARRGKADADADRAESGELIVANVAATPRYHRRRWRNLMATALSIGAAAFGLIWLVLILLVLVVKGVGGLSLAVFTEMTPPPGSAGGLLNPIIGSLILTAMAVALGTPLGILAGTYMAEYGRYSHLTTVVRFINDILLSAPSIVVGLFVYEIMVATMGHFSAWAGAAPRSPSSSFPSWSGPRKICCCSCPTRCARPPPRSACRNGS